jgi:lipoprotein-anchoring transpeptidase ErfK/SrfK
MRPRPVHTLTVIALAGLLVPRPVGGQTSPAPSPGQYRLVPLPREPSVLREGFTADQLAVLEKLNLRDLEHLARAQPAVPGLIVPLVWPAVDDVVAFSPLPDAFEWAGEHPKVIVVHQPWQAFAAYESGKLVRWGPVSTGRKETRTPSGMFNLTWRSKGRHSTDNAAWFLPWYFNFHNERGVSFHQFDLPGYPASHACVRLLERDAKWLYEWGEQWTLDSTKRTILTAGTPVVIVAEYDHASPPPWVDLSRLAQRLTLDSPPARQTPRLPLP